MNVSLSQELERFVHQCVRSGRYKSASEVVREALRLLQEVHRSRQTRQDVGDAKLHKLQLDVIDSLFDNDPDDTGISPSKRRKASPK